MIETQVFKGHDMAERILDAARARLAGCGPVRAQVVLDARNRVSQAYAARLQRLSDRIGLALELADYGQLAQLRDNPTQPPVLFILPGPEGMELAQLVSDFGPQRDAEGLHPIHAGELALGRATIAPPTAKAAFRIAENLSGDLSGCCVTVVGASPIVGRPLALMLIEAGATVRVAQASTRDLIGETCSADMVISAAGVPGLITPDHIRPGAQVIDVGATWRDGALVGDVDATGLMGTAGAITHVPDGVGPVTSACLLDNITRLVLAG